MALLGALMRSTWSRVSARAWSFLSMIGILFARSVASNTKQNWRCGHAATTSFEDSEQRWVHPGPCANSPPAIKNLDAFFEHRTVVAFLVPFLVLLATFFFLALVCR
jgi:hypothetical protein